MNTRPKSVTIIGWVFIAVGIIGFAYHTTERLLDAELAWVLFVRILAIVGGVFILRGANWARWLVLCWMAYHVALSAFHSLDEFVMHLLLLLGIAYVLLRAKASNFFCNVKSHSEQPIV